MNEYNFDELCVPLHAELVAFARKRTGEKQRAEDIVQDAYVRALRAWERWVPQGEPVIWARAWMFRIVTNVFNNDYERANRHTSLVGKSTTHSDPDSDYGTDFKIFGDTRRVAEELHQDLTNEHPYMNLDSLGDEVRDALDRINPNWAAVLRLIYCEGMMEHEAAAELGIPYGTARSRHARGRAALARVLAPMARQRFSFAIRKQVDHKVEEVMGGSAGAEEAVRDLKPAKLPKPRSDSPHGTLSPG